MMNFERKRALVCARANPNVHRSALMAAAGIRDNGSAASERDLRDVVAFIKDHAEFEFVTVYERPGWHTRVATEAIRQIAEYESVKRNYSEQARNLRVLNKARRGTALHALVTMHNGHYELMLGYLTEQLPEPDREPDECLMRIDELISEGRSMG